MLEKKSPNLAIFPFVVFAELEIRLRQRRRLPVDAVFRRLLVAVVGVRVGVADPARCCPREGPEGLGPVRGQKVVKVLVVAAGKWRRRGFITPESFLPTLVIVVVVVFVVDVGPGFGDAPLFRVALHHPDCLDLLDGVTR